MGHGRAVACLIKVSGTPSTTHNNKEQPTKTVHYLFFPCPLHLTSVIAYAYVLTPKGLREKAKITARFLKRKVREYELLKTEIERLRQEVSKSS
jgi:hypothetical protein